MTTLLSAEELGLLRRLDMGSSRKSVFPEASVGRLLELALVTPSREGPLALTAAGIELLDRASSPFGPPVPRIPADAPPAHPH
jgi:hypothetical protein